MLVFRTLVFLRMVAGLLSCAVYLATGEARWRRLGLLVVRWTVIAALGFFAVLLLERLALVL